MKLKVVGQLKKRAAATQAEFDKKYGTLQGQYDTQAGQYQGLQKDYQGLDKRYLERGQRFDALKGRFGDLEKKYDTRGQEYGDLQTKYGERNREYGTLQGRFDKQTADLGDYRNRISQRGNQIRSGEDRDRRRENFGADYGVPGTGGSTSLASDKQRQALLTGDYSFMDTEKGRGRRGGRSSRDENWRKYLG